MLEQLKIVFIEENRALIILLQLLEEQYRYLIKEEVFKLDEIIKKIETTNKEVATLEIKRRKIVNGKSMKSIINECNDEDIIIMYRDIKKVLADIIVQKDSNEILIKQGLGFTTHLLNVINPKASSPKTYNSYGKVKRW